ncbi:MAG: PAS domain S-box protein [Ignavibacteriales bacterium]
MKGKREKYFRDVFDRLNDAVLIIHPAQEKIADANPKACSMLGYSREELSSLLIFTVYPETPKLRAFIQSVLGHGRGWTDELTCLTKAGLTLQCETSASTVDIAGTSYIVSSIRDITERRQMEAVLRENLAQLSRRNRYQTIISTVTQSVHQSINTQDVVENAVESLSKNIDGMDIVSIYIVEGEEAFLKAHRGLPDQFAERVGRIPYPTGAIWKTIIDGKPIYCADVDGDAVIGPDERELGIKSYLCMPIWFEDGVKGVLSINSFKRNTFDEEDMELMGMVAHQIEIAFGNAQQAEMLRKREERFRNLVEGTGDWVWEMDENCGFTYVSPTVSVMIGYEPEKVLGKALFEFVSPEEAKKVAENCPIPEGKPSRRFERTWIRKDGRPVVLETNSSYILDNQGAFQGYRGIARDITERRRMEEEKLKTSKLESLGVLAGGIAHDFNNLLSGILTTVSVTKTEPNIGSEIYDNLTEVEKMCLQARELTQQLLAFSRGGAPVKKPTPLEPIIRDAAIFALRSSNVRCEIMIEDNLWDAEVDAGQIAQAITNILINADQAMPQGGVIKIKAQNLSSAEEPYGLPLKDERYVKITIEDEGVGIPKDHLAKIFDPYFTTKQRASGLGLSMAYSIIKNHDGYIGVESELGKGTKFYIYIPALIETLSINKSTEEKSV